MTILASFDMFIVKIEFDSAMHSTDLLSSFRFWFRCARTLGVLRGVFSYFNCCDLKYYITTTITSFSCREECKSTWINR